MKIATVLSVSAVFALTSLVAAVGCSAPAPADAKGKAAASQNNDNDNDDSKATTPSTTTPGSTTTTPGATTKPTTPAAEKDGPNACLTCVGATTKAGLAVKCADACNGDEACFTKCDADNCGADGAACKADFDKCSAQCSPPDATPEQEAKFQACIAKNPKAKAFADCNDKCTDAACEEKCWTDSKCDAACDTNLEKCATEAGLGGG